MSYEFNLTSISLQAFKEMLKHMYLIPSMRVLLEDVDQNFLLLEQQNINNVGELHQQLKTKKKAALMAETTGIDFDYMIVLRRMISSYVTKPRKLEDYPDIKDDLLVCLTKLSIKTSKELYDYMSETAIEELKQSLNIDDESLRNLKCLMAVTRLRYVSPLFATVLVKSGYDSIEKIAAANNIKLYEDINETNKAQKIYRGNIGHNDAQFLIEDAAVFLKYDA